MRYAIIDVKLGEKVGIYPKLHRLTAQGTKMVVNENELKLVNPDIVKAAQLLGGEVMTQGGVLNEIKKTDKLITNNGD